MPTPAEELHEAVRRSSHEVDRLAQLAEDLLLLARSHGDSLPLRVESLDVADLVTSVASRFEWRAQAAGRPLSTEQPDGLRVQGDPLRLEQALGNLVDNALRYGEGAVRVSARSASAMVELHVTDEGPGIPPEFMARAFERFSAPRPGAHARRRGSRAGDRPDDRRGPRRERARGDARRRRGRRVAHRPGHGVIRLP